MNLLNVASLLQDAGVAALADDLFISMMPAGTTRGLLLRLPPMGTLINHDLPGYYKAEFQMIARAPDYLEAQSLIEQAVSALKVNESVSGTIHYHYIRPVNEPVSFPISAGSLIEFSVRMSACYVDLTKSAR